MLNSIGNRHAPQRSPGRSICRTTCISTSSCVALAAAILVLAAARADGMEPAEFDQFGGMNAVTGMATGWFHIESINGRDVLVTPQGHAFVALGVNHVGAISKPGPGEPDVFQSSYGGDWNRFRQDLLRQYREWKLNAIGSVPQALRHELPYTTSENFVKTAKYYNKPGESNPYEFPDVFDLDVKKSLEQRVAESCRAHRDNPRLIAYYWTDTPTWDIHKTRKFRNTDWVSEIRRLGPAAAGKVRYVEFLKGQYEGDVERFGRAYNMRISSYDDLLEDEFGGVDLERYDVHRDDQRFLGLIAEKYYDIVGPAMRRNDPNHLIFGEKYLMGDHPDQVITAAAPHIDALALQPGDGYIPIYTPGDTYPKEEIERLHKVAGKPVFICDHQISFGTRRYPTATWPYHQRPDEADAARATERFIRDAFAQPYVIGYMRCQYIDRYSARRGGVKLGLIRDDGTPYAKLVQHTKFANQAVIEMVRSQLQGE